MGKIKEYISRAYGPDALSMGCVLLSVIMNLLLILLMHFGHAGSDVWSLLALIPLVIALFRTCSVNRERRKAENDWFVRKLDPFLTKKPGKEIGQNYRNRPYGQSDEQEKEPGQSSEAESSGPEPGLAETAYQDRKYFKFFKCPACRQKIRVPRGKGKIEITCPRCGDRFIKKT